MSSLLTRSSIAAIPVYAFGGVELDKTNQLLRIDGKVLACPELVFKFLLLLCESPHQLILREELIDHLWPGGQVISDEAITQVLFRARTILGPYGSQIKTVRGKGVRLDAVVSAAENRAKPSLSEAASKPRRDPTSISRPTVSQEEPGTEIPAEQQKNILWTKPGLWVTSLVTLLAIVMLVFWSGAARPPSTPQFVNVGYGLMTDDLHAANTDTAHLIHESFKSEANGERSRNLDLLKAVHRSDPQTPVPAIFLALWIQGSGDFLEGSRWIELARVRSATFNDAYLNLLIDYVEAEVNGNPEQIISRAGALLDIRPNAWRMHHARAHLMEFTGMREAALLEIQQIEVTKLDDRKLSTVIADRASMGDIDGAQAMLDKIPASPEPAMHAFLNGRLAWSRGDWNLAHDHWIQAAELAFPRARMDIYRRAMLYAGAIEAAQGLESAESTLLRARNEIGDGSLIDYTDASLLLAHLYHEAGRIEEMQAELETALAGSSATQADWIHLVARFSTRRLWPEKSLPDSTLSSPDMEALWQAMQNYTQGNFDAARAALAIARSNGIEHTRLGDEARWLEWKLGESVAAELPIDPPYPPLTRLMVRRELQVGLANLVSAVAQPFPSEEAKVGLP